MSRIQQQLKMALDLYTRAIELGDKELAREIGKLIDDLSDIQFFHLDDKYDEVEVGNRIACFKRRLSIIESRGRMR